MILFFLTMFPISLMPGINMIYALNLGMSHGYARSLPALIAQTIGIALVSLACILGIAGLFITHPSALFVIKVLGGIYILYLGISLFRSNGKFEEKEQKIEKNLFAQGFVISTTNPKAWIFFAAIYPKFIDTNQILGYYNFGLIGVMCLSEIIALSVYSLGGTILKNLLKTHLRYLEIFCAILMCVIGILMIFR
ncbi:LysE family translocator [Campylobacter sp. VBCF_05 NA6]|uniref:LysE family translocator n=1 Tax=unclassified Campylobacter TaxID=2593542 RepID=UPI0022E9A7E5|nr:MULTISPECIES: LysE family translocator [unclassified Campylobacter]MDA3048088.1 LysE family translocator [Campylobacter sp. JMF_08 NE1]MDA3057939.1 LysE family translocator [Campylobacter sp. VBCF_04 NA7]MDA3059284.1 LysE family translocator [Campylobacter sp. VBCF_05 NA6]